MLLSFIPQGPKLTVLCRRQVATEIFFSVAKWKNLVAKKWFVIFLLHSETQNVLVRLACIKALNYHAAYIALLVWRLNMTPPPFHIPVRSLQEASHEFEQVAILLVPGHFRTKLFVPVSRRLWVSFAENMAAANFRLQCADYNGCEGHLTGVLPFFFSLNYFLWRLKTSTRQGLSFLLKSNAKFFDLIPWVDTTLKVSRLLATSLAILVANTQFSLALATSWSQFRTLSQPKK